MTQSRDDLRRTRRWVIKLGSSLLTNDGVGLNRDIVASWVSQIITLRKRGCEVVLVSSGSIAEGIARLGMKRRPHALHDLQAAAAVGQMGLIQAWESCFQEYGVHTAQILLSHDDIAERSRYLNARSTLRTLVKLGVVPVINENDTVATEEIRLGDNDTLAGLVSNLIEADAMVILTDQAGLFDKDPRRDAGAAIIREGRAGDPELERYAGRGGELGRGGMLTKLRAAATAAKSGTTTVIASGREEDVLLRIADGAETGTVLFPEMGPLRARKQWLAGQSRVNGALQLDEGAVRVLKEQGRSLLAVGVAKVEGEFRRGGIVRCLDPDGREIARGLVNYNSDESRRIIGQPSDRIESILGYVDEPELIHRDNLIVL
ncbi:MAG: glutamate 5-kinase [Gammaproteobacteria bacterium]